MSDHIVQTISDLEKKVQDYEAHALRIKTTINELCSMAGMKPRYAAEALEAKASNSGGMSIRSDQFHARPVATIVREYLEMRRRADVGPATTDEIFDALAEGGYEFKTKNEQIARVSLNNALTKNPIFYKLPNKRWGLLEWYPKAKQKPDAGEDEEDVGSAEAQENRDKRLQEERDQKEAEEKI